MTPVHCWLRILCRTWHPRGNTAETSAPPTSSRRQRVRHPAAMGNSHARLDRSWTRPGLRFAVSAHLVLGMNQSVPRRGNSGPRHFRHQSAGVRSEAARGLANDLHPLDFGQEEILVRVEIRAGAVSSFQHGPPSPVKDVHQSRPVLRRTAPRPRSAPLAGNGDLVPRPPNPGTHLASGRLFGNRIPKGLLTPFPCVLAVLFGNGFCEYWREGNRSNR